MASRHRPLEVFQRGNRYYLVAMEYLSRWAVTVPLPVMDTETPATALLYEVVLKFGSHIALLRTTRRVSQEVL